MADLWLLEGRAVIVLAGIITSHVFIVILQSYWSRGYYHTIEFSHEYKSYSTDHVELKREGTRTRE